MFVRLCVDVGCRRFDFQRSQDTAVCFAFYATAPRRLGSILGRSYGLKVHVLWFVKYLKEAHGPFVENHSQEKLSTP